MAEPVLEEPVLADVVSPASASNSMPPKSTRNSAKLWITCGILALVGVIGAFVGFIFLITYYVLPNDVIEGVDYRLAKGDAKWAEVADAYSNPRIEVSESEAARIADRIEQANQAFSGYPDSSVYEANLDSNGFCDQMIRTDVSMLSRIDRGLIETDFTEVTHGPMAFDQYEIVSVIQDKNPNEVIVYLYMWDEYSEFPYEYRWWLRRTETGWKLTDWESLQNGITETELYAHLFSYQEDKRVQKYYEWYDAITMADMSYQESWEDCVRQFRNAGRLADQLHPGLSDSAHFTNGTTAIHLELWDEGEHELNSITNPKAFPAIDLYRSYIAENQGDLEKAIELVQSYSDKVGFSPAAILRKFDLLSELNKVDEAKQEILTYLELLPRGPGLSQRLARTAEAGDLDRVVAAVNKAPEPVEIARELHDAFAGFSKTEFADAMSVILKANGSKFDVTKFEAEQAYGKSDFEMAAKLYLEAVSLTEDEGQQELVNIDYVDVMLELGKPLEAYQNAPLKSEAFEYIADSYIDGYYELQFSELQEVVGLHSELEPASDYVCDLQARLLWDSKRYEELVESVNVSLNNCTNEIRPSLTRMLFKSLVEIEGNELNAFAKLADNFAADLPYAYGMAGEGICAKGDWNQLNEFLEKGWARKIARSSSLTYDGGEDIESYAELFREIKDLRSGQPESIAGLLEFLRSNGGSNWPNSVGRRQLVSFLLEKDRWREFLSGDLVQSGFDEEGEIPFESWLFDELFERYLGETDAFNSLLKQHESLSLSPQSRLEWKCRQANYLTSDSDINGLYFRLTKRDWNQLYAADQFRSRWILALIRMKRLLHAKQVVSRLGADAPVVGQLLIGIETGDLDLVAKSSEELATGYYGNWEFVLASDVFRKYLTDESFAEVRNEIPILPLSRDGFENLQFFFEQRPDATEIDDEFGKLFDEFQADSLKDGTQQWIGIDGERVWAFALNQTELTSEPDISIPKHNWMLSITSCEPDFAVRQQKLMALALAGKKLQPALIRLPNRNWCFLNPAEQLNGLSDSDPGSKWDEIGNRTEYFYENEEESPQVNWKARRAIREHLSSGRDPELLELLVVFRVGNHRCKQWLPVEKVNYHHRGGISNLFVRRVNRVPSMPEILPGDLQAVALYEVEDVRLRTKDAVTDKQPTTN